MDRTSRNPGSGVNINPLNDLCHWNRFQQAFWGTVVRSDFCRANPRSLRRKWIDMDRVEGPENPLLALGLGRPTRSSDNSKASSPTACTMSPSSVKQNDEESSMDLGLNFDLCLGHDAVRYHKKSAGSENAQSAAGAPKLDLHLSLSAGLPESAVTNTSNASLNVHEALLETMVPNLEMDVSGKRSEPSNWFSGYSSAASSYASEATYSFSLPIMSPQKGDDPSPDVSSAVTARMSVKSLGVCTSGVANPHAHNINTRSCQFPGCEKGARGASGHYCIVAHGGGRRCQKPGCLKGAEGRTIYCKGSLCVSHGGGRRCQFPDCTKGALQGSTKLCNKAHGGGKRCTFSGCTRGAEGSSTCFCKGHGGGKRCCSYQGDGGGGGGACSKSVHGGTQHCVAHGGGKRRCSVSGCTKSARGRTEYCVRRHGGGERCKFEGRCGKSAQGSTDFCKAHGDGGGHKRCSWRQEGSQSFGVGGPPCDKFARSESTGLCAAHSALIEDRCVRGGGSLGPAIKLAEMQVTATKGDVDDMANGGSEGFPGGSDSGLNSSVPLHSSPAPFPEGRVHGHGLFALLSA